MTTRYRKRPVEVAAVQWTGKNLDAVRAVMRDRTAVVTDGVLRIPTLEGEMQARNGDWIVRGVQGESYPVKPDIFAATYEAIEDAS